MSPRTASAAAVLVFTFGLLGWNLPTRGLGSGFLDPVGLIRPQDEVVHTHSALQMAQGGSWLTPRFLDRPATYKPPLLYWLSAASMKLLGPSAFSARLPSLLAASLASLLVFWWISEAAPLRAAWFGWLLLLGNGLWHTLARVNLTDAPLALFTLASLAAIRLRDWPALSGVCAGLAILTKGPAGLLALLPLAFFLLRRFWRAALPAAAVAAPWFLYQLAANFDWFWREFVLTELLHWGLGTPPQTSPESALLFYARRLLAVDPLLALLGLAGLVILWRRPAERILFVWLAVSLAALFAYAYRNWTYALPFLPLLAIAAAQLPLSRWTLALAAFALVAKAAFPAQTWGLPFQPRLEHPRAALLQTYCEQARPYDLIIIGPQDDFYATLLPLARVRYAFLDAGQPPSRPPLDLRREQILLPLDSFLAHPQGPAPYGTGILYHTPQDLLRLQSTYPADYLDQSLHLTPTPPQPSRPPNPACRAF